MLFDKKSEEFDEFEEEEEAIQHPLLIQSDEDTFSSANKLHK